MRTRLDDDHGSCFSVYPPADQTEKKEGRGKAQAQPLFQGLE